MRLSARYRNASTTASSVRPLYAELVRRHKEEGVSFRNAVIFNLYEYYPLSEQGSSSIGQLNELFLNQVDIDRQNVFTPDGTIPQDAVIDHCLLYEQRIKTYGGLDIAVMGIGREGNIAMNEPGSTAAGRGQPASLFHYDGHQYDYGSPPCLFVGMGG